MRVAVAQVRSSTRKIDNLELAKNYIREASRKKAQLIAFPEFLMAYSPKEQSADELYAIAEDVDGEFVSTLRKESSSNKISIVATIYEKSNVKKVYDTAVLISEGDILSIYRKLHLYDALGFRESDKLVAGEKICEPVNLDKESIGIMICYDIRFPELSRILAIKGANILVIPSAWVAGEMKVEHWQTMLKARAIENGCYVVAPDQTGNIYIGRSMVVDPFGRVIFDMEEREGLEIVDLDPLLIKDVRERLPLLKNRRSDLYSIK